MNNIIVVIVGNLSAKTKMHLCIKQKCIKSRVFTEIYCIIKCRQIPFCFCKILYFLILNIYDVLFMEFTILSSNICDIILLKKEIVNVFLILIL